MSDASQPSHPGQGSQNAASAAAAARASPIRDSREDDATRAELVRGLLPRCGTLSQPTPPAGPARRDQLWAVARHVGEGVQVSETEALQPPGLSPRPCPFTIFKQVHCS